MILCDFERNFNESGYNAQEDYSITLKEFTLHTDNKTDVLSAEYSDYALLAGAIDLANRHRI